MNARTLSCLRYFLTSSRLIWNECTTELEVNKRCFSISTRLAVVQHEVTKRVKQYGKLFIDVPFNCEVKPTDPHDYPDMDTLIVKFESAESINEEITIDKFLSIDVSGDFCKITAKNIGKFEWSNDTRCLIEAPIQYDVDVRTSGDSDVLISGMVSDLIDAKTERGNVIGAKLQATKMKFHSNEGGSIDLRNSLQGDIEIKTTKNGSIKAEKCLGTSLQITTENGDVSLGSNYCERAIFTSVNGNMSLNNLHMDANIDIRGKGFLNVSCLDGSLRAKVEDGETKIHVVRLTGKSHIISKGPIHLIVPRENNVRLTLKAHKLILDEGLGGKSSHSVDKQVFEMSGEIPLNVETSGNARVTGASWAESLQLGKFAK